MSHRQFGTLKYIRNYEVTLTDVRSLNLTTFGSLLKRGWIKRNGNLVLITDNGEEAYLEYAHARVSTRLEEGEISDRVSLMLKLNVSKNQTANQTAA